MMIELPPAIEQLVIQEAQKQGITTNEYVIAKLSTANKPSVADLVKGKQLEGFNGDPVAIQQSLR